MFFHWTSVLPSTLLTKRPMSSCALPVRRRRRRRLLHLRLTGAGQDLGAADEQARIDAERPADDAEHHDGADAQSAAADRKTAAPAAAVATIGASILDVAAFRQVIQAHGFVSLPASPRPSPYSTTARINAPCPILGQYSR